MIAVVGGYGVGMTMRLDRAPDAGETVTNGVLSVGPGGKGSNQAIGIARLGHAVSLFSAVGPDDAARDARALWAAESVDATCVVTTMAPTMTGFITVDSQGENRISIAPGALAELTAHDAESFRQSIRSADLLVVSLEVPLAVALRALEVAREEGTRTLLNPAPATRLTAAQWALVDILTPNASEAEALLPDDDRQWESPEHLATELARHTGCEVVLTVGAAGSVVVSRSGAVRVPPMAVQNVADTTGAGDAFTAALAVAVVEGVDLRRAARFATVAGAHAVTIREVVPALPHRDRVTELLHRYNREFA